MPRPTGHVSRTVGAIVMAKYQLQCLMVVALLGSACHATADELRYYEENGYTYCETRRTVRRPVTEVTQQPVDRTFYRPQQRTEYQTTTRTVSVPVTEYRPEAYWKDRWNPFVQPTLAERLVPRTRWETRTETVQVPVARNELVPEVRQEHVPVVTQRYVEDQLVSRVLVSTPTGHAPATSQPTAIVAQRPQGRIGGISRLDSVPPHQISDGGWRPAAGNVLR